MGEDFFTPWMTKEKADNAKDANNAAIVAQSKASDQSIAASTKAAEDALKLQREQFEYQKSLQQPFFEGGKPAFDAYAKEVMTTVGPNGEFTPTESDAYKWQAGQAEKNNSRVLRALGRENSSYGMGEQFKSQQGLAANEYDKQLARLADLTNIARGGASALAGASAGFTDASGRTISGLGGSLADLYSAQGNNLAASKLAGGLINQNSMFNAQQNMGSLANLGLKVYDTFKSNGGSGGYSNTGNYEGMTYGDGGYTYDNPGEVGPTWSGGE